MILVGLHIQKGMGSIAMGKKIAVRELGRCLAGDGQKYQGVGSTAHRSMETPHLHRRMQMDSWSSTYLAMNMLEFNCACQRSCAWRRKMVSGKVSLPLLWQRY
jgi:hypothetical protein